MNNRLRFLAFAGICMAAGQAWSTNLVANGGFEDPVAQNPFQTMTGSIGAWSIDQGSVDLIRSYWQPHGGDQSIDIQGNDQGTVISQTIACQQGQTYRFTISISGNPDGGPQVKSADFYYGGTLFGFAWYTIGSNSHGDMQWFTGSVDFVAGVSNGLLEIVDTSGGPGFYGMAIDDVSVEALVPEPTSLGVLAIGTLAFLRKRSR